MVNTFVVCQDYKQSATYLDNSRLGKQRSECKIIINVLTDMHFLIRTLNIKEKDETLRQYVKRIKDTYFSLSYSYKRCGRFYVKVPKGQGIKLGYCSHPATLLWFYNLNSLKEYTNTIINEWKSRGKNNTMPLYKITGQPIKPCWLNEEFIISHQANLKRKDPDYYKWDVDPNLEYVWPY